MIVIPSDSRPFLECRLYADGTLLAVLSNGRSWSCEPLLSTNRWRSLVKTLRRRILLQTIYVMFRGAMTSFSALTGGGRAKCLMGKIRHGEPHDRKCQALRIGSRLRQAGSIEVCPDGAKGAIRA